MALNGMRIMEMMGGYRQSCVIGAAAELNVWDVVGEDSLAVEEIARRLRADLRATTILLDAVAAIELLEKANDRYSTPGALQPFLRSDSPQTVLPMLLHQMNILRGWSGLAWTVRGGIPAPRPASVRGPQADRESFIAAMHSISSLFADELVAKLTPFPVKRLLDVGGASGTWTKAFLTAFPSSSATIFDLPDAVVQARARFAETEFASRVDFAPGDFYTDELPQGADFAWVSAIVHQHDRAANRELFAKVRRALVADGLIAVRDVVMEPSRTEPTEGALFAVNMLVNTDLGGTFTFAELAEDLTATGFVEVDFAVKGKSMDSVVIARKAS